MKYTGLWIAVILWSLAMSFIFEDSMLYGALSAGGGSFVIAIIWLAFFQEKE